MKKFYSPYSHKNYVLVFIFSTFSFIYYLPYVHILYLPFFLPFLLHPDKTVIFISSLFNKLIPFFLQFLYFFQFQLYAIPSFSRCASFLNLQRNSFLERFTASFQVIFSFYICCFSFHFVYDFLLSNLLSSRTFHCFFKHC